MKLKKELISCQRFLVVSQFERVRNKLLNYAIGKLNTTIVDDKVDHFFNNLKCTAKVNQPCDFILEKQKKQDSDIFTHTKTKPWRIDPNGRVCTKDELAKLKVFVKKTDIIESCSEEALNTKGRFYKLRNLTEFAVLLKDVLMGCKDDVLPDPLLKNHSQLSDSRREYMTKTKGQLVPFSCLCSALALKSATGRENFKRYHLFLIRMYECTISVPIILRDST